MRKAKMTKPKSHGPAEFLRLLAPHIVGELRPPTEIKEFTKNTAAIGAYVEGAVRELIRRQVHPLRVATGAVIDEANKPGDPRLPQLDTIVWAPSPAPAVFQVGDFALVPRSSSFGVLEIKSSAYDTTDLDKRLSKTIAKRVTADALPIEKQELGQVVPSLGVICLRTRGQSQTSIRKMKLTVTDCGAAGNCKQPSRGRAHETGQESPLL
jgi:hypothetical protein